jgi:uncharacterized LabA/DUF88 family protein
MFSFGGSKPETTYLFIDGSYLRRYYTESVRQWFGFDGEIDFTLVKQQYSARKSFYYDCLDDIKREGENETDFNLRVEKQEAFFNKIREVTGSHVRLGSLTGTAKNKRQKEVDILLAVDMLNHAVRQNMNRAVLLAGDRDFKPVVESLVQMGIFVDVVGDKRHTSKDLAWSADTFTGISFSEYYQWSAESHRKKHPVNILHINMPPADSKVIQKGLVGGKNLTLYKSDTNNNFYIFVEAFHNENSNLTLQFHDLNQLKLYFELQYGKVDWQN